MKTLFKLLLVVLVLGVALALIAGPARIGAVVHQAHASINHVIDQSISDPVALRAQLHQLEKEYPDRIATVRGDLAELQEQLRQLHREQAVASRVVELAQKDRSSLESQLALAETQIPSGTVRTASYGTLAVPQAQAQRLRARVDQVQHTILAYANRAQDAQRDLGYLQQQEARLLSLLAQLEGEHAQFRAQLLQLDRQVDALARNERLIDLMEKRQKTIEQLSRYDAGSLDQLQGRLAEIRSRQEAQLEVLANTEYGNSYEDRARFEVETVQPVEPGASQGSWIDELSGIATVDPAF